MAGEIEARLKALDLVLPEARATLGTYVPYLHLNGQLFISGQLPLKDGHVMIAGKLGAGLDVREFSAHGLRSGFMTEAARQGVALPEAMAQSQHPSVQQAARYYNHVERQMGRAARLIACLSG